MKTTGRRALLAAASAAALALSVGGALAGEILWWTPNWGEPRARELAQKFEAANPDIKVNLEITVSDGLPARIQTALVSGSPPDLIEAQHGWVAPYAQAGLLLPLDDVLRTRTTTFRPRSTTTPGTESSGASPTASRRTA